MGGMWSQPEPEPTTRSEPWRYSPEPRKRQEPEPSKDVPCWRDMPWSSRDELRDYVLQYKPDAPDIEKANIGMFGLVGSGKSSTINTLDSIVKGRISARAEVLSTTDSSASITKKLRKYTFRGKEECRFTLCDTMGMEESQGLDLVDVPYILDGHIPDKFRFTDERITPSTPGFIKSPSKSDRIHSIICVVNATTAVVGENVVVAKFKKLRELASARGIRIVILVTHVDELCPLVAERLRMVYRSRAVFDLIKRMSALTGLPESYIFAVKNYKTEIDPNPFLEVLFLKPLKLILGYADDCFEDMED